MSPRIPIAGSFGARRIGRTEERVRELQKAGPGSWVWVGDYPSDSYTTFWSPPWENDWERPGLPYAPLAFRWSLDGRIELGGYPDMSLADSGTVAFTLPTDWRVEQDVSQIRDVVLNERLVAARYEYISDTGEVKITLVQKGVRNIKVFADPNALDGNLTTAARIVVAGDGKFIFEIDADEDGAKLYYVRAFVSVAGSGVITVQLRNMTQGNTDMLSTRVTIDSGELSSRTAATPAVINPANATVANGDQIAIDVDTAGGGVAEGLGVNVGIL